MAIFLNRWNDVTMKNNGVLVSFQYFGFSKTGDLQTHPAQRLIQYINYETENN